MRLKHVARRMIEGVSGHEVERIGGGVLLHKQSERSQVWPSLRAQTRAAIDELHVDLVLDVGANEGQYGAWLRRFYHGELHSFEPVQECCSALANKAAHDPDWHVHRCALGADDGDCDVRVAGASVFSSALTPNKYGLERFGTGPATARFERVPIRRIESMLPQIVPDWRRRRVFLKMDTQGLDLQVFGGLGQVISAVTMLQSELSLMPIYENMPHWLESLSIYERAGFAVCGLYPVNRDGFKVIEFDALMIRSGHDRSSLLGALQHASGEASS